MFRNLLMVCTLFCLVGCNGGSSSSNYSGSSVEEFLSHSDTETFSGTITTPEPTSMALVGGGLIFMFKNRKRFMKG